MAPSYGVSAVKPYRLGEHKKNQSLVVLLVDSETAFQLPQQQSAWTHVSEHDRLKRRVRC